MLHHSKVTSCLLQLSLNWIYPLFERTAGFFMELSYEYGSDRHLVFGRLVDILSDTHSQRSLQPESAFIADSGFLF